MMVRRGKYPFYEATSCQAPFPFYMSVTPSVVMGSSCALGAHHLHNEATSRGDFAIATPAPWSAVTFVV